MHAERCGPPITMKRPWLLAGWLLALATGMATAQQPALELVTTIALPGVMGRIDHFAADVTGHRLFMAALGNDTVEVIDTEGGGRRTISGLSEPQGVLYVSDADRLVIANGSSGRVDVFDATSLESIGHVSGMNDADNVRWLPATRSAMVGYGKGALRILDPTTGKAVADIRLPAHPESFQADPDGKRAYVNVPGAHAVILVDLTTGKAIARWDTPQASANFPMALDAGSRRLFVGARAPPVMLVYDVERGNVVARVPIGKDTDDIYFDAQRKRIYVICGQGRVDVIQQVSPDEYVVAQAIATSQGARTGIFVPEARRLYIGAPASGSTPARVLVYRVD